MERRVLISYAADDPDWTPEQVEAVASAIEQAGIRVHLDRWHQRDRKRRLSLAEWQTWMDASIDGATHILCLVSARYRALWARDPAVPGGYGVAFESTRLIHHLYLLKQHNDGRILTLRPDGHGYDCIPRDLALDCPEYCWRAHLDDLLSHLGEAELPSHAVPQGRPPGETLHAPPRPEMQTQLPWASDSGEDTYGRWADLTIKGVTQRMRWIPPTGPDGFWMGAPQVERDAIDSKNARDWANQHEHEPRQQFIDNGFWLADTPCTQAFWHAVTGTNPSHFKQSADAPERPVENVRWEDVMRQFIARFAAMPDWSTGKGLCLPTEVEWEYAARAGARTAYWWGNAPHDARANWDRLQNGTTPVQRYRPNPWGLHDVHGNVWEWCEDVWQPRRSASDAWRDKNSRVVRGGSWFYHPGLARVAYRDGAPCKGAFRDHGFRFAMRFPRQLEALP